MSSDPANNDGDPSTQTTFSRRFDDRVNKIIVQFFILFITAAIPALAVVAWNDHQTIIEIKSATAGVGGDHEKLVKIGLLQEQHSKDISTKIDSGMADEHLRLLTAQDAQIMSLINQAQSRMDRMQADIVDTRRYIFEHENTKPLSRSK